MNLSVSVLLLVTLSVGGLGWFEKSQAAPYPVTSSSILTDPQWGLFYERHGFRLKSAKTSWALVPEKHESVFDTFTYRAQGESQFTVRLDQISKKMSLELYAKKWMREYPQYGFEILGTKPLQFAGDRALLVDIYQRTKGIQLRQLILNRDLKVVILTCSDELKNFKKTLVDCNRMMTQFEWVKTEPLLLTK